MVNTKKPSALRLQLWAIQRLVPAPADGERRRSSSVILLHSASSLRTRATAGLQLGQHQLDLVVALELCQPLVEVVLYHLRVSLAHRLAEHHLLLHAVERRDLRAISGRELRVAGLAHGTGPTMLG